MSARHTIGFRVSDETRAELLQLAHVNAMSVSEVVRTIVETELAARAAYFSQDGAQ